jgi:hypothetical protein
MICKIAFEFYLLQLLCADYLELVLHNCNVNTFETLNPFDIGHGILSERLSSHGNVELSLNPFGQCIVGRCMLSRIQF